MQEVYDCPSDIDLFTGGISQRSEDKAVVGKVFKEMFIDQFRRTRDGDRFFFSHTGGPLEGVGFTHDAIQLIKRRTMSGVICDTTSITTVPKNVFSTRNVQRRSCEYMSPMGKSEIQELIKFSNGLF